MSYSRGFSLNAVSTGLVFALGWVNQWLLANHLDKAEYGRLGLWTVAVVIGAMLFGEWLRRGSTYVVGREEAAASARDNALLCFLVILAGGMGLACAGAGALSRVLGPEAQAFWPLLGALPALVVLQRSGQAVLLGLDPHPAVRGCFGAVHIPLPWRQLRPSAGRPVAPGTDARALRRCGGSCGPDGLCDAGPGRELHLGGWEDPAPYPGRRLARRGLRGADLPALEERCLPDRLLPRQRGGRQLPGGGPVRGDDAKGARRGRRCAVGQGRKGSG